ncbi:MAG: hypothetical protein JRN15_01920 [Nitrososphaerota archaeon]|nr:hypothetical protein [Nitrososphaerota archaeon]
MLVARFLKTDNQKYLAIATCFFAACVMLYLCGALYIQFMLLLGAFALFPALLVHERSNLLRRAENVNLTDDENWSKTKKELDKARDNMDKAKSAEQRRAFQRRVVYFENELRRIEWKVKESDMNQMYNAARGNLRKLPELKGATSEDKTSNDVKKYTSSLVNIIKEVRKIVEKEPPASRQQALVPIANLVRAQYNTIKKTEARAGNIRGDYFAVWATLSSFIEGNRIDSELSKYSSDIFRKKFLAFQDSLSSFQSIPKPEINGFDTIGSSEGLDAIARSREENDTLK